MQKQALSGWGQELPSLQVLPLPERLPLVSATPAPGDSWGAPAKQGKGLGVETKPAPAQQVWEEDRETRLLSQVRGSAPFPRPALCSHRPDPLSLLVGFGLTRYFMALADPAE